MSGKPDRSTPWFKCWNPRPEARKRLICFHHAGGTAHSFRQWAALAPPDIEVHAAQLPGRLERMGERPYTRVAPLVEAAFSDLQPLLDRDYAIMGYSFGALLGFETLRLSRKAGVRPPRQFFSCSRIAPQVPNVFPPFHGLGDEEFIATVDRVYKSIPSALLENPDLLELMLPTLRADFEVFETYLCQPEPAFDLPFFAWRGTDDETVPRALVEPWAAHTTAAFSIRELPGGHFLGPESETALADSVFSEMRRT